MLLPFCKRPVIEAVLQKLRSATEADFEQNMAFLYATKIGRSFVIPAQPAR